MGHDAVLGPHEPLHLGPISLLTFSRQHNLDYGTQVATAGDAVQTTLGHLITHGYHFPLCTGKGFFHEDTLLGAAGVSVGCGGCERRAIWASSRVTLRQAPFQWCARARGADPV